MLRPCAGAHGLLRDRSKHWRDKYYIPSNGEEVVPRYSKDNKMKGKHLRAGIQPEYRNDCVHTTWYCKESLPKRSKTTKTKLRRNRPPQSKPWREDCLPIRGDLRDRLECVLGQCKLVATKVRVVRNNTSKRDSGGLGRQWMPVVLFPKVHSTAIQSGE